MFNSFEFGHVAVLHAFTHTSSSQDSACGQSVFVQSLNLVTCLKILANTSLCLCSQGHKIHKHK